MLLSDFNTILADMAEYGCTSDGLPLILLGLSALSSKKRTSRSSSKKYFYLKIKLCVCGCVWACARVQCRRRTGEGAGPGAGVTGGCELSCECWDPNSGPLEDRQALTPVSHLASFTLYNFGKRHVPTCFRMIRELLKKSERRGAIGKAFPKGTRF